jgi:hypothetical protein
MVNPKPYSNSLGTDIESKVAFQPVFSTPLPDRSAKVRCVSILWEARLGNL